MNAEYNRHMRQRGETPGHPTVTSALDAAAQFKPYFRGERIKVTGPAGTRTGTVGMSGGWMPVFLLMHRSSDLGSSDVLTPEDKIVAVQHSRRYIPVQEADDFTEDTGAELAGPPQRCLNCGAREGQDCQPWCAFKPHGRPMTDVQAD